jgi:hypothetical protein
MFSDTPLPPEEPAGQNPPDGAILDYYLPAASKMVSLEVLNKQGHLIRTYASTDPPEAVDSTSLPHPTYWIRSPQRLSTAKGHHRFIWDLRHEPPPGADREFSIAAVYHNTPSGPHGPFVHPGSFTLRLTVDGTPIERPIEVRLDPRVTLSDADLQLQTDFSMRCYQGYLSAQAIREAINVAADAAMDDTHRDLLLALRGSGAPGDPDILYGSIYATPAEDETVIGLQQKLLYLLNVLQSADAKPTSQTMEGVRALESSLVTINQRWEILQ